MNNNSLGNRELTATPDVSGYDEDELIIDAINNMAEVGKRIVEIEVMDGGWSIIVQD